MRADEADTLAKWALDLGLPRGSVCLNVGSSTGRFRKVEQPHIHRAFIEPLEKAGIRFIHCDMKAADGVDEVGDILDPKFQRRLQQHDANLLVCSNLLEHLTDPRAFAQACGDLVPEGGYGLFSVPSSYPYHPDPIDTMLRPSPAELAAFLPGWTVVRSTELEVGNYWQDLRRAGRPVLRLIRHAARVALPFYKPGKWRENASRLSWLLRPYKVSIVLLRKGKAGKVTAASGKRARQTSAA